MIQQITDQRTLRKLLRRVEEIPDVKSWLEAVRNPTEMVRVERATELLELKKVKENQHMTALLSEIKDYLLVENMDAARAVSTRVLEAEPVKVPEKFVKEHIPIKETNE